ncbi:(2Fe-2S)-binding protein, partial [Vibrio sp.]|uniref:(2Fe-2S)-binding protein n=1 Tax=Vibrio sp. TaxID=678 RepID=UPI003D116A03
MHWAGDYGGQAQINRVVAADVDPISGQPAFKSSQVQIECAGVKSYGLYLGQKFASQHADYVSFQADKGVGIWRFAMLSDFEKSQFRAMDHKRSLILEIEHGWIGIECQILSDTVTMSGVMVISSQPIHADYNELKPQIGQPLNFSKLMQTIAAEQSSRLICSCFRVTDRQIVQLLNQPGGASLTQLQSQLKCGTNCGSCIPEINNLIEIAKDGQTAPSQDLVVRNMDV